jgi:hypothetical protein
MRQQSPQLPQQQLDYFDQNSAFLRHREQPRGKGVRVPFGGWLTRRGHVLLPRHCISCDGLSLDT